MLGSQELVAFVPVTDLDRARGFYAGVLGLTVASQDDFACVLTGGATTLRATKVGDLRPQPFTVLGWVVPDIRATLATLAAAGVSPLVFDGMGQDAAGVWTAPSGAQIAWFHDPDDNVLSLTQP
jgi:catechol 2,3-dioxygenase-like lactoylglutathione lyase family enzyme